MPSFLKWAVVALASAAHICTAQTYTKCDPMKKTCPADTGLSSYTFNTDFTKGKSGWKRWNTTAGTVDSTPLGAEFSIKKQGDAPTIVTDFYIFFGYVELRMRAANGTAIVSTSVLESDDLDEIDWEQVSTFDNQIQTNYFGKGNTTTYDRATTVSVSSPEESFHTYAINWTQEKIEWFVDGTSVRTLLYSDAVNGSNFPQTPMRIKMGIWAGGDPNNQKGTIEWAGGVTDYTKAPFNMYLESIKIINYNPADEYKYMDQSGSFKSIKALNTTTNRTTTSSAILPTRSMVANISSSVAPGASASVIPSTPVSSSAQASAACSFVLSFVWSFFAAFVAGVFYI